MGVCIGLYGTAVIYIILHRRRKLPDICYGELAAKMFLCMIAANTLALMLFISGPQGKVEEISRNAYGKGKKAEELEVTAGKNIKKKKVTVEVQEQKYTEEERKKNFEKAVKQLDVLILGENREKDHVDHDLNLVKKLPDLPIAVEWELDRYDVMNVYGEIQSARVSEEGTKVRLRGTLSYEGEEFPYLTEVIIYPQKTTEEEALIEKIQNLVSEQDERTREEATVKLPGKVDGSKITWRRSGDNRGYVILLLGIVVSVSLYALKKQEEKKTKTMEQEQLIRDYPEIVSKMVLLLGAGMTVRNAWKKVVTDYNRQKEIFGTRKAYEEMSSTLYEIQGGVTEAEGYERFGRRCALPQYLKLGALLSQNLKKGTSGLTGLLKTEAAQAFEERKNTARKVGEEASTKLLLPMFLMLAIVLVIVIVPAFLSVQL